MALMSYQINRNPYQIIFNTIMKSQGIKIKILQIGDQIANFKAEICLGTSAMSLLYIIFSLFDVSVVIAFVLMCTTFLCFLYMKAAIIKKKGIINVINPRTKKVLLERSIMDIYRDLIYFPKVTKIIGAFLRGAITKPHPEQINEVFEEVDSGFVKAINTKGILHLAPSKLEKFILQNDQSYLEGLPADKTIKQPIEILPMKQSSQQIKDIVPKDYGKINLKWDNYERYQQSEIKVHEISLHTTALENLSDRIKWRHIVVLCGLLGYALMKTKAKKMSKIFLYNGSAVGLIIVTILISIKYSKGNKRRAKKTSIIEQVGLLGN